MILRWSPESYFSEDRDIKTLEIKRDHWKIENTLHNVLDDGLRKDRSAARKNKNNLADTFDFFTK